MNEKPLVLVTGASGYIATHCIAQLLEAGYPVRGTLRSLDKEARLRKIFAAYGGTPENLSFVVADLLADAGWDAAMTGCDYVLHVASPVTGSAMTDEDFVRPALDGTRRVLQAAASAGVKRVVQDVLGCRDCGPEPA